LGASYLLEHLYKCLRDVYHTNKLRYRIMRGLATVSMAKGDYFKACLHVHTTGLMLHCSYGMHTSRAFLAHASVCVYIWHM